ncbi:MAG: hypothetical protein M4579_002771 [Chaenotheca gracillima]|nr:MAG: hypothetical protein M4579_002771 [Chaenotheca gracillima]
MASTKKTVLITGCSPGGIGNAIARQFHTKGLRVFATARNKDALEDLAGLGIETLSLDVNSESNVAEVKAEVERLTSGSLDYLVNNAGRNYTVPALEVNFDEVQATFETNLFAVMRMCQAFAPLLIEAKGTIVQIGSIAGTMPYVYGSVYNATKAALHSYSDTLRVELAPFGVKVSVIYTGGVKSRIARTDRQLAADSLYLPVEDQYQRRVTHSQDGAMPTNAFAQSVVGAVLKKSPSRKFWQGNMAWVAWFIHCFMPSSLWDIVFRRMFQLDRLAKANVSSKKSS